MPNKYFTQVTCLIIPIVLFFSSCQKSGLVIPDSPSNSTELFDVFWNKMNTNYVYWDIDTTNWDRMYNGYKPLFAKLDIKRTNDKYLAVQYFQEMTKGLKDCHYNIIFSDLLIPNYVISPSFIQKQKRPDFHQHFYYYGIDTSYLDYGYQIGTTYSNSNNPITVLCGTIENRFLFFSCTEFALYKTYHSSTTNPVQKTIHFFFSKLLNLSDNIQGIIIDLRGNQGGDLGDLNFFVGHFINFPLHFGYTQTKSGNGRLDFTPWINAYANPEPDGKKIDLPIVVLADMYTASLAEAVLMAFKVFPKCTFIGENTWGATGPLVKTEVYNAGQFQIDGFLNVTTASCKFKYMDGNIYEGKGFPPDIILHYDENSIINGRDIQLEKAISLMP
ncbi:MAG TPA: S41 family peptidase [Bacteroidales bacterium]